MGEPEETSRLLRARLVTTSLELHWPPRLCLVAMHCICREEALLEERREVYVRREEDELSWSSGKAISNRCENERRVVLGNYWQEINASSAARSSMRAYRRYGPGSALGTSIK